jgi:hypothetical protein
MIIETYFFRIEFLEELSERLMLDASRERPATHDPGIDSDELSLKLTQQSRDLA